MPTVEARLTDVDYVEVECKSALNPVKNMGFAWSLNPYTGCEHRCAFCYVRAFELRADRPSDDRYGRTVRVKSNIAPVLRAELSRRSWRGEMVVVGAATDPYQPAEGRFRLTRQCLAVMHEFSNPTSLITRGPMIVRDVDVLTALARRADVHITFSIPTVDDEVWRKTEPGTAHPRQLTHPLDAEAALHRHHFFDLVVDAFAPEDPVRRRRASTLCKAPLKKSTSRVLSTSTRWS